MLSTDLPPVWILWRAKRTRELMANGVSRETAALFADAEAKGRARLANVIGYEAAVQAELGQTQDANGEYRWHVIVDPHLVPPEMRAAAEQYHFAKKRTN